MLDKITQTKQKRDLKAYISNLSEKQKTILWLKSLISVQSNLPEIIISLDKVIESNASSISFMSDIYNKERGTYAQVEKVIDLSERKNKLLNLYVISKKLLSGLKETEKTFIKRKYVNNWTAEELATEYEISTRTVFRWSEKLLEKIYIFTKSKNWSLNFINSQVKDEPWLYDKFKRFAKDSMNAFSEQQLGNLTPPNPSTEKELEDIA